MYFLPSPSGPIAIGAHIQGLGRPHNGPDIIENMLCLCPNHHDQFDNYSYHIDPIILEIVGLDDFKGKKINKILKNIALDCAIRHDLEKRDISSILLNTNQ